MFFALVLGVAATLVPGSVTAPLIAFLEGGLCAVGQGHRHDHVDRPYAVACLLFTNTARFGLDVLMALIWFVVTVLLGLAIHMGIVYSASVAVLSRMSPMEFFRRSKTAMLTAFSTSSSNATLPTALRVAEENLHIPRGIGSFVLTVGATANQNGTALYEGVTVLFLAQLAGVELAGAAAHQLDEHVERRARRVLERVADGVAHDGRLVRVAALAAVAPVSMYFFALSQAPPPLFRNSRHQDAGDGADHQEAAHDLGSAADCRPRSRAA